MYATISSTHNRIMCCCISSRTSKMAFGCSGIVVIQPYKHCGDCHLSGSIIARLLFCLWHSKSKGCDGMDLNAIAEYLPLFGEAALLTVKLGVLGIIFSIIIGLICAVVQYYKVPVIRRIVSVYIEISRNTPLLVQLFFIYYGLPKVGIPTDAETCGIAGLAFLGGSYMAEAFRSGLESVDKIQTESAYSLGMNKMQAMRYVILPQAMSVSIPAFVANVIFLMKETSVFSAISLLDLMFMAKDLMGMYNDTTEALCLLVGFYLIILLPISIVGTIVERRVRRAGFGG